MAAIERLSNLGYGALKKEATAGTPVIPNTFFKFYKATLNTDMKLDEDDPIAGVRSAIYDSFPGQREHAGQLEVLAEPNTAQYWFDMLLTAGSITGGGDPYTHPFTEGLSNSYTMEFLKGQLVERYWGVQTEDIECAFDKNKMKFMMNVSALGSFLSRKLATISTVTITLDTTYDPVPNKGLVQGDLVRIMKADGSSTLDTTIATSGVNADGITLTIADSAAAFSAGDFIFLRAQTPTFTDLFPFLWARLQFQFGTSAAVALSAAQLRIEQGSKWKITNKFNKKGGEDRSGGFDPDKLVRLQTSADLTLKTFFDQPDKLQKYLDVASNEALVIKMLSASNHELRLTFNNLKYKMNKRDFDSGKILYQDMEGHANYNATDGQAFSAKVINNLSS